MFSQTQAQLLGDNWHLKTGEKILYQFHVCPMGNVSAGWFRCGKYSLWTEIRIWLFFSAQTEFTEEKQWLHAEPFNIINILKIYEETGFLC